MGKLFNLLFYFVFAVNLICVSNSQTENQRLCADPECQKIISTGTTLRDYHADTKEKISFKAQEKVEVYSKPIDPKGPWEIKIRDKRGLAPKDHLMEQNVIVKKDNLVRAPYQPVKSDKEDKLALKGSIPIKTEETSTPPLPKEPAMVTSQQSNENIINSTDISSDPTKSVMVEGTMVPTDALQEEGEANNEDNEEEEEEDDDDDFAIGEEEEESNGVNSTAVEDNEVSNDKSTPFATAKQMQQSADSKFNVFNKKTTEDPSTIKPELSPSSGEKIQGPPVKKADEPTQEAVGDITTSSDASDQVNVSTATLDQKNSNDKEKSSEVPASDSGLRLQQSSNMEASNLVKDELFGNVTDKENNSQGGSITQESKKDDTIEIPVFTQSGQTKPSEPVPPNKDNTQSLDKIKEKETVPENNGSVGVSPEVSESGTNTEKLENEAKLLQQKQAYEYQEIENKTESNQGQMQNIPEQNILNPGHGKQETVDSSVQPSVTEPHPSSTQATPHSETDNLDINTGGYRPERSFMFDLKNRGKFQRTEPPQAPATKAPTKVEEQPIEEHSHLPITETVATTQSQPTEDHSNVSMTQAPATVEQPTVEHSHASITDTPATAEKQIAKEAQAAAAEKQPIVEHSQTSMTEAPATAEKQLTKEPQKAETPQATAEKQPTEEAPKGEAKTETQTVFKEEIRTTEAPNLGSQSQSAPEAAHTPEEVISPTTEPAVEAPQVEDPTKRHPFYPPPKEIVTESVPQTFTESSAEAGQQSFTEIPLENQKHFEELPTESTASVADETTTQQSTNQMKNYPEQVKTDWFFSNVLDTVYNFWSTQSKEEESMSDDEFSAELQKTLFPEKAEQTKEVSSVPDASEGFCEKLTPDSCPSDERKPVPSTHLQARESVETCSSEKDFFSSLSDKVLEMVDLLACLLITALTTLLFAFGYYCICHSRKEGVLLSKLNIVERSLLASSKESAILKHDLIETRNKLTSIEDNSFGSNDMVIALKSELQESEEMKIRLQDQVASLEKELENAAEAGLELNKIVSELLNNQSGDESIISSVEELQKQLNEQQNTIIQINTTLAEKSRENSELQLIINNQGARFDEEVKELKQEKQDLQKDKAQVEADLEELRQQMDEQLLKAEEDKCAAVAAINKDMAAVKDKYNDIKKKLHTSEARVQVLEECLNGLKHSTKFNIKELLDAVNLKTDLLATRRERDSLKERLEGEIDARKLLEDHVTIVSEEVSRLKQEYNQSEKEKVEAKTRLEVLSSYFKEKETQLQKELSLKDALWLKQQGETSSTVERVQHMQDEIQFLKSQNDSLRAEIEAQAATHKAQIANFENRAHETWLAARQSERKMEEARTEATALRRKLTSFAGNPAANDVNSQSRVPNSTEGLQNDVNNVPSPVHMESPGSPLLGGLPPPLPFLPPPPFMGPPHPFMPMPPPFMPPGEMRPPPLGRLMSPPPPPPPDRYSPSIIEERNRYSPENGRYSPDSRYNYTTDIMSNYDTETDFSPPLSPGGRPGGGNTGGYSGRDRDRDRDRERSRAYKPYSPPPPNSTDRNKKSKGILSSGSADSYDSRKSKGKRKV